ncbi:MAG: STAS domain-containing protein [Motilibacteraceae bacterium]
MQERTLVELAVQGPVAVVTCHGELDTADDALGTLLSATVEQGHRDIVVDMLDVTFIDSSVIGALVGTAVDLEPDGSIRLVYTHHMISRVLQICGLAEQFPQYPTVAAALREQPRRDQETRAEGSA